MVSKRVKRVKKVNKSKKLQKGGVGFSFNLQPNCRIGGLPERVSTSDCPSGSITDPCNIKKAYGQSCNTVQNGGKKSKKSMNKRSMNKRSMNKKSMNKKSMNKKGKKSNKTLSKRK